MSIRSLERREDFDAIRYRTHRCSIEDLTGRVIRLEAQLDLVVGAAVIERLKAD